MVKSFTVKNILVQTRVQQTYLWITFNSETSRLDEWSIFSLRQVLATVMTHADLALGLSEQKIKEICFSKIDLALDLAGAFIPPGDGPAYSRI